MESIDTVSTQELPEDETPDFLETMRQDFEDTGDGDGATTPVEHDAAAKAAAAASSSSPSSTSYTGRKPKWWHRLGQGKPTKGQKKAMQAMQATHRLPRLPYDARYDWSAVFETHDTPEESLPWLEIGCGTGENVLALAEQRPALCMIGAEMQASGIGNCFQRIYQATQRQGYFRGYALYSTELEQQWQTNTGTDRTTDEQDEHQNTNYNDASLYSSETTVTRPYSHVRIFAGNGVKVLEGSPDASLDTVLITFPDPFPRHPSYRLLQLDVLDEMGRVLRPGIGRLVVATDHDGHAAWVAAQVGQHKPNRGQWILVDTTPFLRAFYLPAVSKYEAKGWREGRTTKVLIYELRPDDA